MTKSKVPVSIGPRSTTGFETAGREDDERIQSPPEWALRIVRVQNGYILEGTTDGDGFPMTSVIEDDDEDELSSGERLLWEVMDYFSLVGSKYDKERLRVVRRKRGDDL